METKLPAPDGAAADGTILDGAALVARIRQGGRELGFDAVGGGGVDLTDAEPGLAAWLGAGAATAGAVNATDGVGVGVGVGMAARACVGSGEAVAAGAVAVGGAIGPRVAGGWQAARPSASNSIASRVNNNERLANEGNTIGASW